MVRLTSRERRELLSFMRLTRRDRELRQAITEERQAITCAQRRLQKLESLLHTVADATDAACIGLSGRLRQLVHSKEWVPEFFKANGIDVVELQLMEREANDGQ
jgi:hypothetical protein